MSFFRNALLLSAICFTFEQSAVAQEKPAKAKHKSKKPRHEQTAAEADQATTDDLEPVEPETSSALFPDWPRPSWDFTLGPLFGFKYAAKTTPETGVVRTATLEGGLVAGVSDVPLVPGNPGFGVGAHAAQAWGAVNTVKDKDQDEKPATVRYRRAVGGVDTSYYYHFLRNELGVTRGRLEYVDDAGTVVQSTRIRDDIGVLVLSWFSAHYTYTNLRANADHYSQILLQQHDHWLHALVFTDILKFHFDMGPGFTEATEYSLDADGKSQKSATGRTDFVKVLTGMHLFWKLGATGDAKYVFSSTEDHLGTLAGVRFPEQELGQASNVALPEDSLTTSFFFGIADIAYGIGAGWRYNLEILNLGRHQGRERVTTKDQGLGLTYSVTF